MAQEQADQLGIAVLAHGQMEAAEATAAAAAVGVGTLLEEVLDDAVLAEGENSGCLKVNSHTCKGVCEHLYVGICIHIYKCTHTLHINACI